MFFPFSESSSSVSQEMLLPVVQVRPEANDSSTQTQDATQSDAWEREIFSDFTFSSFHCISHLTTSHRWEGCETVHNWVRQCQLPRSVMGSYWWHHFQEDLCHPLEWVTGVTAADWAVIMSGWLDQCDSETTPSRNNIKAPWHHQNFFHSMYSFLFYRTLQMPRSLLQRKKKFFTE